MGVWPARASAAVVCVAEFMPVIVSGRAIGQRDGFAPDLIPVARPGHNHCLGGTDPPPEPFMPDFPNDDTQLDASERVRIASAGHGRIRARSGRTPDRLVHGRAGLDRAAGRDGLAGGQMAARRLVSAGAVFQPHPRRRLHLRRRAPWLRSLAGRSEAIHGSGLYLPWQVRALEADSVDLVLTRRPGRWVGPGRSNACSAIGWMPAA